MTRLEMFNSIVQKFNQRMPIYSETTNEKFMSVTLQWIDDNGAMDRIKQAVFVDKADPSVVAFNEMGSVWFKGYVSVNYDLTTQKINVNQLLTGYKYAGRKKKIYPFRDRHNLVTFTDQIYYFTQDKANKPRRFLADKIGGMPMNAYEAVTTMLDIDYVPSLPVSLRYYYDAENEWDACNWALGFKVPSYLKKFAPADVYKVFSVLKNPEDRLKLSMYIQDNDVSIEYITGYELYSILTNLLTNAEGPYASDIRYELISWFGLLNQTKRKITLEKRSVQVIYNEIKEMMDLLTYKANKKRGVNPDYSNPIDAF